MIPVMVALPTVACGGRRKPPKSRRSRCSCRNRRRGPPLKVCLCFWCVGESYGGDKGGFGVVEWLAIAKRERELRG